jgi:hypothetical protein
LMKYSMILWSKSSPEEIIQYSHTWVTARN